ncbi:hypothetical protein [Ferrovum sp.]|uniref:hypothetical protein n=1 Tax=Ferrovum sp. TaxID=2609467 RepID=UPI002616D4DE|nr:hypothetical protein [Ferrovum sp.]
MFKREFEWRDDEEFGGWGWIPKGFPNFNAGKGRLVTHDTLEHFANDSGTLEAEIRALGAMVLIRGEGGYFWNKGSIQGPGKSLGADLARFYSELSNGMHSDDGEFSMPPRTRCLDTEGDYIIEQALKEGERLFIQECEYDGSEDNVGPRELKKWEQKMRGWLRIGYRKAVKRYHNALPHELSYLFNCMEEKIDTRFKSGEQYEILTVKVDPKKLSFRAEVTCLEFNDDY